MARFGGDATFGLDDFGEADAPTDNGDDGEGFDLDRDAIPDGGFDMKGLDDALPGELHSPFRMSFGLDSFNLFE